MTIDQYAQPPRAYIGKEASHCTVDMYEMGGEIYFTKVCKKIILDAIKVVISHGHDIVSIIKNGRLNISLHDPDKPQWHYAEDIEIYYKSGDLLSSLQAIQLFLKDFNITFSIVLHKRDIRDFSTDRLYYKTPMNYTG